MSAPSSPPPLGNDPPLSADIPWSGNLIPFKCLERTSTNAPHRPWFHQRTDGACGGPAAVLTSQRPVHHATPSMPGGVPGCGVVQNDQGVDGDAGSGIDQEWVDLDRRNP